MKLVDLVKNVNNYDDELIIYVENLENYDSDILIAQGEMNDNLLKKDGEKVFHYLIEIFIAKDFINEGLQSPNKFSNEKELANKLFDFGKNDA